MNLRSRTNKVLLTIALGEEDDCLKYAFAGLVLSSLEFDLWLLERQVCP